MTSFSDSAKTGKPNSVIRMGVRKVLLVVSILVAVKIGEGHEGVVRRDMLQGIHIKPARSQEAPTCRGS